MPTECPRANLQRQLGSKTFARTTEGAASRQLSLACLESILSKLEVQRHERNLELTPLLAAVLFQTVPFSFCLYASIFFTSAVWIQASPLNSVIRDPVSPLQFSKHPGKRTLAASSLHCFLAPAKEQERPSFRIERNRPPAHWDAPRNRRRQNHHSACLRRG